MQISKTLFMFKRFLTDLSENKSIIIQPDTSQELNNYYILFSEEQINRRGGNKPLKFDDQGILQIHSYIDIKVGKGYYYYPITIGQYALAVFHAYLKTKSQEKKEHFLKIALWFYNNRTDDPQNGTYWETTVPKPEYKVFSPWKSAFAQSRALSVLLRAWQLTGNIDYLEVCKKALIPFTLDIEEDGVTANKKKGYPFYEEYVADAPTMVLDGHMFSLFGLYDFMRAIPENLDKENHLLAKKLFNDGISSLEHWLPKFDMGFWMCFNYCQMDHYPEIDPCTIGYSRLVRTQLDILFKLSGQPILKKYHDKLQKYDSWLNILRMYPIKYNALKKLKRI